MGTEQDSVRRLAEIREHHSACVKRVLGYSEESAENHIGYLLSLIDSLTAERDKLRAETMHTSALLDGAGLCREHFPTVELGWLPCIKCGELAAEAERDTAREQLRLANIDAVNTATELEAAEAEVKRLREALGLIAGGESLDAHGCARVARAALSTPPSEGGKS